MNLLRAGLFVLVSLVAVFGNTGCGRLGRPVPPTAPPLGVPASPTTTSAMTPWPTPTPVPTPTSIGGGLPGANPAGTEGLSIGFPVLEAMTSESARLPLEFVMLKAHPTIHVDVLLDTRLAAFRGLEPTAGSSMTWKQERVSDNPKFDTRVKIDFTMPPNAAGARGVLCWFKLETTKRLDSILLSPQRPTEPGRESHFDMLKDGGLEVSPNIRPPLEAPARLRGSVSGLEQPGS